MPAQMADTLGLTKPIRAIPITETTAPPLVGLVYPQREPMGPLTAALVGEAKRLGDAWLGPAPPD
jgi:hypothetical protein